MQITNRNKLLAIILILAMSCIAFVFSACDSATNNQNSQNMVVDIYGRQVNLPENVETIATVGSATRIVAYAGAIDKLVAITEMDKESATRPYTIAYSDKLKSLPVTNNGNHLNQTSVDKESLIKINPDVVLSSRSADECEKLQAETKIPVVGVSYQDEIFSDSVYKSIEIAGQVAGTTDHSTKITQYLKNANLDLQKRSQASNSEKIYRGAVNYKGSKGLLGTISNYCVYSPLNAKSVSDKENFTGAYDTTVEQIYTWNPDMIFIDCTNREKVKNELENNSDNLKNVNAIKNQKIYCVAPFNNNGTNIEYGLCEAYFTGKQIYPDQFADIDCEKKFSEIFQTLLGKDIYSQLKDNGIYFGEAKL